MSIHDLNLCVGCMSPLAEDGHCPHCNYRQTAPQNPNHLPPRTVLEERYLLGRPLFENGEGVSYIAFDAEEDEKVLITEFYPTALAHRSVQDGFLRPKKGREVVYKTLLSSYIDTLRHLSHLSGGEAMVPLRRFFEESGTVYAVYKAVGGKPLSSYLMENGGELDWNTCKRSFLALCSTVTKLHKEGLLHGGISPTNIWVDDRERMLLFGFHTPSLRTEGSEIEEELFPGYSAPEQYQGEQWQGKWTDVYALAAVLYRVLTGTMPPDAVSRRMVDNLIEAKSLNSAVPDNVSFALDNALTLNPEVRTPSVDEFTAELLEDTSSNTTVFISGPGDLPPVDIQPDQPEKRKNPQMPLYIGIGVLMLAVVTVAILLFSGYWSNFTGGGNSSSQSSSSRAPVPDPVYVPNFVGMYYTAVINNTTYKEQFDFSMRQVFSDEYPEGVIVGQLPEPDVKMINKGTVILTVSLGSEVVPMPNIVGSKLDFATQLLSSRGIRFQVIELYGDEYEVGIVGRTSILAGTDINRVTDTVVVYVGRTAPETSSSTESEEEQGSTSSGQSADNPSSTSSSSASGSLPSTRPAPEPDYDFVWGGFVDNNN